MTDFFFFFFLTIILISLYTVRTKVLHGPCQMNKLSFIPTLINYISYTWHKNS